LFNIAITITKLCLQQSVSPTTSSRTINKQEHGRAQSRSPILNSQSSRGSPPTLPSNSYKDNSTPTPAASLPHVVEATMAIPIHLAYGFSFPLPGVFLSVSDRRLKYETSATKGGNAVSEAIGLQDGGGSYFDIHTGKVGGFGIQVDDETMASYLLRYMLSEEQIRALPLKVQAVGAARNCNRVQA
jgi:hypothetical protein